MTATTLSIKVDVDTDRGTRIGVPNLVAAMRDLRITGTFLFSLGPDNTGRAIKRIFRPGFLRKVVRTSVVQMYGVRTMLNGVLLPGPHIGRRNEALMRAVRHAGHEVGIHCYDHIRWQDGLSRMSRTEVFEEFAKAGREFERIFGESAKSAGAAGWKANHLSLDAYDAAGLLYASDARGDHPFFPRVAGHVYDTLQIPTTLPTLDELLGRPEYPEAQLVEYYLSRLRPGKLNALTVHAEIEGMQKLPLFRAFLTRAQELGVQFCPLEDLAHAALADRESIPVCDLVDGIVEGRSGELAVQICTANV